MRTIQDKVENAIKNQFRLELEIKYGLGDTITVDFDPYILGQDLLQYTFIWGFLPYSRLPYKFRIEDIIMVNKVFKERFKIDSSMIYYYSLEEEHYYTAPDFEDKNPRYNQGHEKINY